VLGFGKMFADEYSNRMATTFEKEEKT